MRALVLYATVVVFSTAGLMYELVIGAVSTYLLGDTVTQFSTIVGTYMSAMGLGAYLTRHVEDRVATKLVDAQLASALSGGLSAPVVYGAFAATSETRLVLYVVLLVSGTCVGAQIPLFMRVLRRRAPLRELVSTVLTLDYVGALLGALGFALVLLPHLGSLKAGIALGAMHAICALLTIRLFESAVVPRPLAVRGIAVVAILLAAFFSSDALVRATDESLLAGPVLYSKQTAYQRIVLSKGRGGLNLYLDGNLQFASIDEYRYHEALVHPVFSVAPAHARVLVLGGGDGLAVREILRYADVREIVLVDLDPDMTGLAKSLPWLRELNEGSLASGKVTIINQDAMVWLHDNHPDPFDVAIVDFPDPNNFALGKLYTTRFYQLLQERLSSRAVISVQSTSPLVARKSYWCIAKTIEQAGFFVRPYHALVPSFGEWGYVLASREPVAEPSSVLSNLRYLTNANIGSLFAFSPDMSPLEVVVNRLNNQQLVRYYEQEWRRWMH